jgi:hypothetical protein
MIDCKGAGEPPFGWFTGSIPMPELAKNTALRILTIDAVFKSLDVVDGLQVFVNEVGRAQLTTGVRKQFIEQPNPALICEVMDFAAHHALTHNFVLQRPGIYPQNIFRSDPYTGLEMSIVCEILPADPGIDSWDISFGFKIGYDIISISNGESALYMT